MYVILSYDIGSKCANRVMKLCRAHLEHVQKSVFEGEITTGNLKRLKNDIANAIDPTKDSVVIYAAELPIFAAKEQIGVITDKPRLII